MPSWHVAATVQKIPDSSSSTCLAYRSRLRMRASMPLDRALIFRNLLDRQLSTFLAMMTRSAQMNRYGLLAQEHWTRTAPSRVAEMDDPTTFFAELGEQIALEVDAIEEHLRSQLSPELPPLERIANERAILKQAEDAVLPELVYSVEPETSLEEELREAMGQLPGSDRLEELLERLEETVQEEAEIEGWPEPVWSEDQLDQKARYETILRLRRTDEQIDTMSEAEMRDLLLQLHPHLPSS